MRSNAEQLRRPDVREQLRTLFRLGTGEAVPTLREVLAILSWAVVGRESCSHVKERNRDLGQAAFTATDGYFTRVVGGGMSSDAAERSPLLAACAGVVSATSATCRSMAGCATPTALPARSGSSPATPTPPVAEAPDGPVWPAAVRRWTVSGPSSTR